MSKLLDSTQLQHMLEAAERSSRRLAGCTLPDFLADEDLQDIALRRFMVGGEAAAHASATPQLLAGLPDIIAQVQAQEQRSV